MNEETKPVEESVEKELTDEQIEQEAEKIAENAEKLRQMGLENEQGLREMALAINAAVTLRQQQTRAMFHQPTRAHSHKKRGVGVTRKNKEQTKKARLQAKKSRTINHKIANKKSRATGSKKRI
jgi:hypothetical protein